MTQTRREAALELATDILADLELTRTSPPDTLKKVSRLARLLDDEAATKWFSYEMQGYPDPLTSEAFEAAVRSGRRLPPEEGKPAAVNTMSLSQLEMMKRATLLRIENASSSIGERAGAGREAMTSAGIEGRVLGCIHAYAAEKEVELRFGAAAESAFGVVRNAVDARIAELVPTAANNFSAAFENVASDNPEHWANAASECRRVLKAVADTLRPPGDPVNGREVGTDQYINRLVDWIGQQTLGGTLKEVVTADLTDFGKRIDALDDAGHKGAHSDVSQYEASRFIAGAYLLIGDILRLWQATKSEGTEV